MTPEELIYVAVLLVSIPAGFAFARCGPKGRQFGGAALGVGLTLLTCGPHGLHSLVTALGAWGLLRGGPRCCGGPVLLWVFLYLLLFRTPGFWGLPDPPPFANALQLLLTLKLGSLAYDVEELRRGAGPVGPREQLIGCLQREPALLELLCYCYCYLGLLTGPFYRLATFQDWVQGPLPPSSWGLVLGRLRWTPLLAALGEASGRLFPLEGVRDPHFGAAPLLWRLLYMGPLFLAFRMRFYVGWLGAEAACLAAAFGGYPRGMLPRPGRGPQAPGPRPHSPLPISEWDFGTIQTIDPAGTESCRRVREGMRCWNQPVQWWLQHYVHQRMPPWHPTLRATGTMLVSAYWHGLHGGYYLSFLSVPLWLAAERAAEAALQRHWADGGGLLAAAPHWFLKMRVFEYLGVAFALRDAASTLRYWASIGFCLHLLPLLILLLAWAVGGKGGNVGHRERSGRGEKEEGGVEVGEVRRRRKDPQNEEGVREGIPRDPPSLGMHSGS